MPSPTARSMTRLRASGFIACPVEKWVAAAGIRKDAFGFGDILAAHPIQREILLIQATTLDHVAHRTEKAKVLPELLAWLRAGGKFEVWGWAKRGDRWQVKVVAVQAEDLADVIVTAPPRRGRKARQPSLFDSDAGLSMRDAEGSDLAPPKSGMG